jgi:hypothetical protein
MSYILIELLLGHHLNHALNIGSKSFNLKISVYLSFKPKNITPSFILSVGGKWTFSGPTSYP